MPESPRPPAESPVAFVLGGGGVLGAAQAGSLLALLEHGITPDLVVGTSVGALNGAFLSADPTVEGISRLTEVWQGITSSDVLGGSMLHRVATLARHGTHLHSNAPLRAMVERHLPGARIEELAVPFQCVAACIETAEAHWFDHGPLADAVLASSAVPGLLPPVRVDDRHFIDGGIVQSVPVARAVTLGARTVYVLHVGRIERPLKAPRRPWEVGLVAFEVARRHQFVSTMASLPAGVRVHVLPSGDDRAPLVSVRYRSTSGVAARIARAREAAAGYLRTAAVREG
ncbi:patatin-like phospholipase family protein [Oryzihumus sp.]